MTKPTRRYQCQLAVVGTGLAGIAATLFAMERGISVAQAGNTGALAYTSGYLDLLGVMDGQLVDDPWQAIEALGTAEPQHPLSQLSPALIRSAFTRFCQALTNMGVTYTEPGDQNLLALTPVGSVKPTLSAPATMMPGIVARSAKQRGLIVDFTGLQGFSAREIVANQRSLWPGLSAARLDFPSNPEQARVFPEVLARMLEVAAHRQQLGEQIRHVLGDAQVVGLPAILGVHHPDKVHAELSRIVGVPVFEIPTMPPAVPGIRLREMCEQYFPVHGVTFVPQRKVKQVKLRADGATLYLQDNYDEVVIETETTLLATGRFLSGGLQAQRDGITEPLLSIPVTQPSGRENWFRQGYFDPRGHQVNRAGVQADEQCRPVDKHGRLIHQRLFAAGALLAGQDWVRQRCGAGIAIASAWKAVESIAALLPIKK